MIEPAAADEPSAHPRPDDLRLVPLDAAAGGARSSFVLTADLARPDGALYGGTGIAVSVVAMETATQRDALWVVTQYVAQAQVGERIDVVASTLAEGARIAQVNVVASVGDRTIFCAVGATALPRPNGLTGQFEEMPAVTRPDDSPPLGWDGGSNRVRFAELGFHRNLEFREAAFDTPQPRRRVALWARLTNGSALTPAGLAYLADMVPVTITRAAGKLGGGFSLDNAMRFATVPPTDWVLLDLSGDLASHGYGHGSLKAWSADGALLATGSQTASMAHVFDVDDEAAMGRLRAFVEPR